MRTIILSIVALLFVAASPALAGKCIDPEHQPVFADVPATHLLCTEIEAMYRDGVTSGCGLDPDGTRYFCPSAPLTRAAGAMFSGNRDPFAQLDRDGRIWIGDHVVVAERFAQGHYWIQFTRNIQFCSREGWPRDRTGDPVEVKVRLLNGTVDVVEIETTVHDQPLDLAFNVRLHCP